jgi:selenophosphate synthase
MANQLQSMKTRWPSIYHIFVLRLTEELHALSDNYESGGLLVSVEGYQGEKTIPVDDNLQSYAV